MSDQASLGISDKANVSTIHSPRLSTSDHPSLDEGLLPTAAPPAPSRCSAANCPVSGNDWHAVLNVPLCGSHAEKVANYQTTGWPEKRGAWSICFVCCGVEPHVRDATIGEKCFSTKLCGGCSKTWCRNCIVYNLGAEYANSLDFSVEAGDWKCVLCDSLLRSQMSKRVAEREAKPARKKPVVFKCRVCATQKTAPRAHCRNPLCSISVEEEAEPAKKEPTKKDPLKKAKPKKKSAGKELDGRAPCAATPAMANVFAIPTMQLHYSAAEAATLQQAQAVPVAGTVADISPGDAGGSKRARGTNSAAKGKGGAKKRAPALQGAAASAASAASAETHASKRVAAHASTLTSNGGDGGDGRGAADLELEEAGADSDGGVDGATDGVGESEGSEESDSADVTTAGGRAAATLKNKGVLSSVVNKTKSKWVRILHNEAQTAARARAIEQMHAQMHARSSSVASLPRLQPRAACIAFHAPTQPAGQTAQQPTQQQAQQQAPQLAPRQLIAEGCVLCAPSGERSTSYAPQSQSKRLHRFSLAAGRAASLASTRVVDGSQARAHHAVVLNADAPVYAVEWLPSSSDAEPMHLAVGTHKRNAPIVPTSGTNAIQIWQIPSADEPGAPPAQLWLNLLHQGGGVLSLSWCPCASARDGDARADEQNAQPSACLPRLGLLAAACADGAVRVFAIPTRESLERHAAAASAAASTSARAPATTAERANTLTAVTGAATGAATSVAGACAAASERVGAHGKASSAALSAWLRPVLQLDAPEACALPLCVEWSPLPPFSLIAFGMSSGAVLVWNIDDADDANGDATTAHAPAAHWPAHAPAPPALPSPFAEPTARRCLPALEFGVASLGEEKSKMMEKTLDLAARSGHYAAVRAVRWAPPPSQLLASVGHDGMLLLWDRASSFAPRVRHRTCHGGWTLDAAWAPAGRSIVLAADVPVISVVPLVSGAPHATLRLPGGTRATIWALALSSGGDRLAAVSSEGRLQIFAEGKQRGVQQGVLQLKEEGLEPGGTRSAHTVLRLQFEEAAAAPPKPPTAPAPPAHPDVSLQAVAWHPAHAHRDMVACGGTAGVVVCMVAPTTQSMMR